MQTKAQEVRLGRRFTSKIPQQPIVDTQGTVKEPLHCFLFYDFFPTVFWNSHKLLTFCAKNFHSLESMMKHIFFCVCFTSTVCHLFLTLEETLNNCCVLSRHLMINPLPLHSFFSEQVLYLIQKRDSLEAFSSVFIYSKFGGLI